MSTREQVVDPTIRVNAPAERSELERRWRSVREAMAQSDVDALFVHSHVDGVGGATRWFADVPAGGGYPVSLVFPLDGPMTLITHGPFDGDREMDPANPLLPGIGRFMTVPSFSSAGYCDAYDADLAQQVIRELKPSRLGIVAPGQIPYPMLSHIKSSLEGVDVIGAGAFVDPIKAVKSPAEQAVVRATAALQDEALAHAFAIAKPGMRESDVGAEVQRFCQERGSEGGMYMVGSAPIGEPATFSIRHMQNRIIEAGDQLTFVVENSGPGGYYSHVGRTAVFGRPTRKLRDEHAFASEAQQLVVEMLRPGADPAAIAKAYDEHMLASGRPPEKRLLGHAQGYDVVEPPLIRHDETLPIAAGMQIGVHPIYVHEGVFGYICDDYLVRDGEPEPVHTSPREIFEL